MTLYYYVLLVLGCEKLLRCVRNMPNYMMCCLMGQKINGTAVSTCENTIHMGNELSTPDTYEVVFDGIKK